MIDPKFRRRAYGQYVGRSVALQYVLQAVLLYFGTGTEQYY